MSNPAVLTAAKLAAAVASVDTSAAELERLERIAAVISPEDAAALIVEARKAARNAYIPYSNFPVGAAVLCADGTEVLGCNVENASYGLTICAERNALFATVALGHRKPIAIAVTCLKGDPGHPNTLMLCGACRQVVHELLADDGVILVDHVGIFTKDELLPLAFTLGS